MPLDSDVIAATVAGPKKDKPPGLDSSAIAEVVYSAPSAQRPAMPQVQYAAPKPGIFSPIPFASRPSRPAVAPDTSFLGTARDMAADLASGVAKGTVLGLEAMRLAPGALVSKSIEAAQGLSGASSAANPGISDVVIDWQARREANYAALTRRMLGEGVLSENVAGLPGMIGFVGATGIPAGVVGSTVTAATMPAGAISAGTIPTALGHAAGMATSGALTYRIVTNELMRSYLDSENAASIERGDGPLTPEKEEQLRSGFESRARSAGLWAAIPLALSEGAGFAMMRAPLAKMLGERLAKAVEGSFLKRSAAKLLTKGAGTVALQAPAFAAMSIGEQRARAGTPLAPDEKPEPVFSLDTWSKELRKAVPNAIFLAVAIGGGTAAGTKMWEHYVAPVKRVAQLTMAANDIVKHPEKVAGLSDEFMKSAFIASVDLAKRFRKDPSRLGEVQRAAQVFKDEIMRREAQAQAKAVPVLPPETPPAAPALPPETPLAAPVPPPVEAVAEPFIPPPTTHQPAPALGMSRLARILHEEPAPSLPGAEPRVEEGPVLSRLEAARPAIEELPGSSPENPLSISAAAADVLNREQGGYVTPNSITPPIEGEGSTLSQEGVASLGITPGKEVVTNGEAQRQTEGKASLQVVGEPLVESVAPGASTPPALVAEEGMPPEETLPRSLAGAKPRYKQFTLSFENDIDHAAYIAAQDKKSARDKDYVDFVRQATGMTEAEVREHGRAVKAQIGVAAEGRAPGELRVSTGAAEVKPTGKPLPPRRSSAKFATTKSKPADTSSPEFKAWFGDSKVVDEEGKPLVVYRGSTERKVETINPRKAIEVQGAAFFTDNPDVAEQYRYEREYGEIVGDRPGALSQTYLAMNNPLEVDMGGAVGDAIVLGRMVKEAKAGGHDGLILRNIDDTVDSSGQLGTTYAVFNSGQVKSIFNRGTWDPRNPSILHDTAKGEVAGITTADVEKAIAPIREGWNREGIESVEVVDSVASLPEHVAKDAQAHEEYTGNRVKGAYDPEAGTMYLVAENLADARDAQRTLLHEAVGHHGLRGTMGDRLDPFLDEIARVKQPQVQLTAAERGLDMNDPAQRREAAEEFFANGVADGSIKTDSGWWQRFKATVRRWARDMGFKIELTDADIVDVARRAHDYVREGKGEARGGEVAYSGKAGEPADTSSPEFKAWFGDSKVVDEEGKPLVVYHGTNNKFDAFDRRKNRTAADFYFTPYKEDASKYGDPVPVYLKSENLIDIRPEEMGPIEYKALKKVYDLIGEDYGYEDFDSFIEDVTGGRMYQVHSNQNFQNDVLGELNALGYDGVVMVDSGFGGNYSESYVVFDPAQVKSIFNRGTWNPNDPRILYNDAPSGIRFSIGRKKPGDASAELPPEPEKAYDVARPTPFWGPTSERGRTVKQMRAAYDAVFGKHSNVEIHATVYRDMSKWFARFQMPYDLAHNYPEMRRALGVEILREGNSTQLSVTDRREARDYYDMPSASFGRVNEALLEGDRTNEIYEPEVLRTRFGLDDAEIAGYKAARRLMHDKLVYIVEGKVEMVLMMDPKVRRALAKGDMARAKGEPKPDGALDHSDILAARSDVADIIMRRNENYSPEATTEMIGKLKELGFDDAQIKELTDLAEMAYNRRAYVPHQWNSEWVVLATAPVTDEALIDRVVDEIAQRREWLKAHEGEEGAVDQADLTFKSNLQQLGVREEYQREKALKIARSKGKHPELRQYVAYALGQEYKFEVATPGNFLKFTFERKRRRAARLGADTVKRELGWSDAQLAEASEFGHVDTVRQVDSVPELFESAAPGQIAGIAKVAAERIAATLDPESVGRQNLDDMVEAITQAVKEEYNAKGWGQHLLTRKNVLGYRGDLQQVMAEYITGFNAYLAKGEAARCFAEVLKDINPHRTPELYRVVKRYVSDMLGPSGGEAALFKKTMGMMFLAGDFSNAFLNATQNFTHGLAVIGGIKGKGNAERLLVKAMKDCMAHWGRDKVAGMDIFTIPSSWINAEEIAAIRTAYERGDFDAAHLGAETAIGNKRVYATATDNVNKALYAMFTSVEGMNRVSTFLAAYRKSRSGGAAPGDAATVAAEVVNTAHFLYGRKNHPEIVRAGKALAQIPFTFMIYPMSNLSFLKNQFERFWAPKSPGDRASAFKVLGRNFAYTFAFGGAFSLPMAWVAIAVYRLFTEPEDDPERIVRKVLHDFPAAADAVTRGFPTIFGIDLSRSMEGTNIAGLPIGIAAGKTVLKRMERGAKMIAHGETVDGVFNMMPDFVRNPFMGFFAEGDVGRPGHPAVKYTPAESVEKALGFSVLREEKKRKAEDIQRQIQAVRSTALGEFGDRLFAAGQDSKAIADIQAEVLQWNMKHLDAIKEGLYQPIAWIDVLKRMRRTAKSDILGSTAAKSPKARVAATGLQQDFGLLPSEEAEETQ